MNSINWGGATNTSPFDAEVTFVQGGPKTVHVNVQAPPQGGRHRGADVAKMVANDWRQQHNGQSEPLVLQIGSTVYLLADFNRVDLTGQATGATAVLQNDGKAKEVPDNPGLVAWLE